MFCVVVDEGGTVFCVLVVFERDEDEYRGGGLATGSGEKSGIKVNLFVIWGLKLCRTVRFSTYS